MGARKCGDWASVAATLALISLVLGLAPGTLIAQRRIQWQKDYESALAQAKKGGRLLVVHFWLEGRPLCEAMNKETFSHPEVVRISNAKFLNLRVDINARPELFDKTIGGRGGLGTCVLDGTGDVVSALPGYADPLTYLQFLEKAERGYPKLKGARAAAATKPVNPALLYLLAETYQELGSSRRAEELFEKMIRLEAELKISTGDVRQYVAFGHERIARFRAMRGKNRDASHHVTEYRKLDPENLFGRLDRIMLTEALVFWIERRFKDSIRILEEGLKKFPLSEERDQMLLALGVVRHEGGDDPKALEVLEKLIKEHPLSPAAGQAKEQIAHIKNPPPEHQH